MPLLSDAERITFIVLKVKINMTVLIRLRISRWYCYEQQKERKTAYINLTKF